VAPVLPAAVADEVDDDKADPEAAAAELAASAVAEEDAMEVVALAGKELPMEDVP
jgi:hypothetical protein